MWPDFKTQRSSSPAYWHFRSVVPHLHSWMMAATDRKICLIFPKELVHATAEAMPFASKTWRWECCKWRGYEMVREGYEDVVVKKSEMTQTISYLLSNQGRKGDLAMFEEGSGHVRLLKGN